MKATCILMLCLGFMTGLYAGDDAKLKFINQRLLGFSAQQGIAFYRIPEGRQYSLSGIVAHYHQPFFKTSKRVNAGIDLSPQFWVSYAHQTRFEAGLNASLNLNVQCGNLSMLSFDIGSGFQYFGLTTARQAKGFAFANNFLLHFRRLLSTKNNKPYYLGLLAGFRHLSNLDLQKPNGGLDNILFGISFGRAY